MRLNRVLQITAAISVAMAATIFTISCSDGEAGAPGASCTIAPSAIGYDVLCGGNKVGELPNSASVSAGDQGAPGQNGKNGDNCVLGSKVGGSYQIVCGGAVKGQLDGCAAQSEDIVYLGAVKGSTVAINCGSTGINFCNGAVAPSNLSSASSTWTSIDAGTQTLYDPEVEECVYEPTNGTGIFIKPLKLKCNKDTTKQYDASTQYCGYATEAAMKAGTVTALPLCGKEKLNDENSTEWNDGYCRWNKTRDPLTGVETITKTISPKEECGTTLQATPNNGAWLNQYCGWATASALVKTVINGNTGTVPDMCDDGKGAHEEAYYAGYCQVSPAAALAKQTNPYYVGNPATVRVSGQDAFCASTFTSTTRASASSRVNEGTWQDEYCGYDVTATSLSGVVKKKLKVLQGTYGGLSATSTARIQCAVLAPNAEKPEYDETLATDALKLASLKKNAQYCAVDQDKVVSLAKPSDNDCASGTEKLNEGAWLGQYCGYATATATTKTKINANVSQTNLVNYTRDTRCGALKPNTEMPEGSTPAEKAENFQYCTMSKDSVLSLAKPSDNLCTGTAVKLNEKVFNGDYCGYATATATVITKITPNAAAGGAACGALTPNTEKPEGDTENAKKDNFQYCQVGKDGKMVLAKPSDNTCVANAVKLNEGSWKGEYCGYNSVAASAVIVKITPTAAQGGKDCGALAPNSKSKAESLNETEYCTVDILNQMTITTERCALNQTLNEGEWKGEFCLPGISTLCNDNTNPGCELKVACKEGKIGNQAYDPVQWIVTSSSSYLSPTYNIETCTWPDEG